MSKSVQYIVVRKDLVPQMGTGKTAAQVAHASLGAVVEKTDKEVGIIDDEDTRRWFNGRCTKVILGIKNKNGVLKLKEKLDADSIKNYLIYDVCNTILEPEEADGTILTCIGIRPISRNNIPKYISRLQLL